MSVALQGENDKPAGGMQFWHQAEEMKPQERRDSLDEKQTNALMVTLIESDGKCPL